MENPNDRQVGGDHYKGVDYEHWDFMTDCGMSWVPACATKYIFRYHKKHGIVDLEKALHYLDKAMARHVPAPQASESLKAITAKFCSQVQNLPARLALYAIVEGDYRRARAYVEETIEALRETQRLEVGDLSANLSD